MKRFKRYLPLLGLLVLVSMVVVPLWVIAFPKDYWAAPIVIIMTQLSVLAIVLNNPPPHENAR